MSQPITTTLARIRSHFPCESGWLKLLSGLNKTNADDKPLSLMTILEINGLGDAIWCLRACDNIDREARLFAVDCAEEIRHLMKDNRSLAALDVALRYAEGEATDRELASARAAAWAVDGDAARAAARAAAWAADCVAAKAAAGAAAWAAAWAADWVVDGDAAWAAENVRQAELFRKYFAAKKGRDAK